MSGFKETEIGFVPKNWQVVELGVVCTQRKEIITPNSNGKGKYVGLEHIQTGVFRLKNYGNEGDVKSAKYKFYDGDILYGKLRPYLDKAVLVDLSGICSTDIVVLKGTEQLLQSYLIGLVHTNYFIEYSKRTTSGVNHPRTSWNLLKKFKFGLPTLEEQCNIAYILSKIQSAIEAQEKIIQTTTELKKALMQKLFTEGLKGEPQKETEIGLVPKSWQVVELGDVCIQRKEAFTPTTNGKGRYVGLEHIQTGEFRLPSYGNESEVRSAKYKFYEEDILYGKLRPYLDKAVLVDISGICSTDIIVLRGNERLLQTYSIGLVHTNKFVEYAKRTTSGVNHPRTSWNSLKKFRFGLPTIKEQKEIGLVLHQLTNKIENNQSRKKVLQSLFKSMLHHLMTGQIRVKD